MCEKTETRRKPFSLRLLHGVLYPLTSRLIKGSPQRAGRTSFPGGGPRLGPKAHVRIEYTGIPGYLQEFQQLSSQYEVFPRTKPHGKLRQYSRQDCRTGGRSRETGEESPVSIGQRAG